MEKSLMIEKFGGLLKEESLSCINDESLLPNACVFEAESPFFGYYREVTGYDKPLYFYFLLEGHYSIERIMRATLNIRKFFKHPFDAAAGYISVFDEYHRAIRIRNLEEFGHIGLLQKFYYEEGFAFHKKVKSFVNQNAKISLSKLFCLEPAGDLMFMDKLQPHHGYFIIPKHIEWEKFKELTREVKFDTSLLFFDASTAFIYENQGITDLVRIYRENITIEKLSEIRQGYMKHIK